MTKRRSNQLKELQERIAALEASMSDVGTMSIAYLPGGQVISVSMMVGQDHTRIVDAKRALQQVTNHLDDLLAALAVQVPVPPDPEPETPPS